MPMDLPGDPKLWPDDPLDRGLVGEWRFDKNTGLMFPDTSGYGNHGEAGRLDTPGWGIGTLGIAPDFDGNNDSIDIGDIDLSGNIKFTLEALIHPTATGHAVIVGKMNNAPGQSITSPYQAWGMWLNSTSPPSLWCVLADGGGRSYITSTTTISLNADHHVAFTYNQDKMRMYIDGVEDATVGNVGAKTIIRRAHSALIGAGDVLPTFYGFTGLIYQSCIYYDRALTQPEAAARYQIVMARASGAKSLWMIPFVSEAAVGPVTYTVTAAAHAVLKMAAAATAAGQSWLQDRITSTAAAQSWLQDRITTSAAGQAVLKELNSVTAAGQAWVQDRITNTAAGQAFLKMAVTATAAGQAVLKEAVTATNALQAYLIDITGAVTAAMQAVLKESVAKTAAAQSWLQDRISASAAGQAWLQMKPTATAAGQAVLKEAVGAAHALQAYLIDIGVGAGVAAMRSILKEAVTKTAAGQAVLQMAVSATHAAQAFLVDISGEVAAAMKAVLKESVGKTAAGRALLQMAVAASAAAQAYLNDRTTLTAAIRAVIKGTMTPRAAMKAYLSGISVKVDFNVQPRATTLEVQPRPDVLYVEDR